MVLPRNATTRRPPVGMLVEMVFEVADDRVHLDAVVLAGDRRRGAPERLLADVEGNEATERARAGERVEQQARLLRRARTELDEGVGAGALGDGAGTRRRGCSAPHGWGSTRAGE